MEVYDDDMVFKSTSIDKYVEDLVDVFCQIRHYNMRLNPAKCVFGVEARKFLGFMFTRRRIEAKPDKCTTILNMGSPQNWEVIH